MANKYDTLISDLEELISVLAQQADSRSTNIEIKLEHYKKEIDDHLKRRLNWFLSLASAVVVAFMILGFEMWERQYDRISDVEKSVVIIDKRQDRILAMSVNPFQLKSEMSRLQLELSAKFNNKMERLKERIDIISKGRKR